MSLTVTVLVVVAHLQRMKMTLNRLKQSNHLLFQAIFNYLPNSTLLEYVASVLLSLQCTH